MSSKYGKRYSEGFKFQVILEALKGSKTPGQIARSYGVHPITLSRWLYWGLNDHLPNAIVGKQAAIGIELVIIINVSSENVFADNLDGTIKIMI